VTELLTLPWWFEESHRPRLPIPESEVKSPRLEKAAVRRDYTAQAQPSCHWPFCACLRGQDDTLDLVVAVHIMGARCCVPPDLVLTPFLDIAIDVPEFAL